MLTLREQLTALYAGEVEPAEVVGAFRRSAVVVPLDERGGLWTATYEDVGWIHAFCDEAALARFVMARADACGVAVRPGEAAVDYVTTFGARLLDVVIPAVGEPTGVALDMGGDTPFFLPPVAGVVPDEAAVPATAGGETA
ncbi:hypothetical protein H340_01824 [Streptomyces mobaraensis NBRC 13819 = DSM 40847]|uniref:SseB protein N-terminal domain-containing protein n=1 Tax=Streptomyces mobaraensis (strain ATCC 29032 / DSM 40847 / JCM 4168 / NBRC 13819 / NCIMB 11159 / IPCR 16-22) TaxID=1223523 RepID=M3AAI3_STRM1|nr:hypothetical protein [Streptomyces mobaraensis]EMF02199.1 hypothetical protein H340_01824 [Streptomyces mobaraensis NBRC 13819 = DSM 40847]